jgi:hypothetical protein
MKALPVTLVSLARPAALAIALVVAGRGPASAASMTVDDPRPVAKAIEEIEKRSGKPITYEDPPYLYQGATVDVTGAVSRSNEGDGTRTLIPKGGSLTFTLPAGSSADAEISAVEEMVTNYNAGHGAATFSVWRGDNLIQVVPRLALGSSGQPEPVTRVLDSKVTLGAKPRTGLELLDEICHAVSARSGQPVEMGTVPANALSNQQIAIGADDEPARAVLEKLIVSNGAPMSWQLLYDPGLKTYYLNLPIVQKPAGK